MTDDTGTTIWHTYSLSPFNSVGGDIVMWPFVGGWASEWVRGWVRVSVTLYLVDMIPTTVFVQSLSNSTLWVMRGGTLLILGHVIKGQVNFGTVNKTLWAGYWLKFLPNHFQTPHRGWWEDESNCVLVTGSKVKVNFGTISIRHCGHDRLVFAKSLSNFTCKLRVMRGGTVLIMGHGVKGQGWHSLYKTLWAGNRLVFSQSLSIF